MLPRLRSREEEWLIVEPFRPGHDPLAELTESLVERYCRDAREHVDEAGGRERIRERLRADGSLVVTASDDGTARVWDTGTGQARFTAKHEGSVEHALLIANGKLVATSSGRKVRLWSVKSGLAEMGQQIFEVPGVDEALDSDTFSPDGKLAVVRSGERAQMWDVDSGRSRSPRHLKATNPSEPLPSVQPGNIWSLRPETPR
jgi:WD40 repeat protein